MADDSRENLEFNKQAVNALTNLFHGSYCEHHKLVGRAKAEASAPHFYAWCRAAMEAADASVVCGQMGVSYQVWERAKELADQGLPSGGSPAWWLMVLADRPKPKHSPLTVNIACLLTWPDGTVSANCFHLQDQEAGSLENLDDPNMAAFLSQFAPQLIRTIAASGLDGLHEEAKPLNYADGHGGLGLEEFRQAVAVALGLNLDPKHTPTKSGEHYLALLKQLLMPPKIEPTTPTGPIGGWTG